MQYREAAVRISQSVELVLSELERALYHFSEYKSEGKVTDDESTKLNEQIQDSVTILIDGVLESIYKFHPDLRPRCCGCPPADVSE